MSTLTYDYRAIDRAGVKRRGTLMASSEAEAVRKLGAQGLVPTMMTPSRVRAGAAKGVRRTDLVQLTGQLSVLMNARIPISSGLEAVAEQETNPALRALATDLAARIGAGESLSSALSAHARVFGRVYIATIRASEASGTVIKALDHLAEMLERDAEARRQIRAALMYPMCVLIVLALAGVFLIGFVVPKFSRMFADRGVELPLLTQGLVAAGNSVQSWWWVYGIVLVAVFFGARWAWRTPGPRGVIDQVLGRVPVVRDLLRGLAVSRFARVFGLTLGAGLPIIECLDLAGEASGRVALRRDADTLMKQVSAGGRLSEVFASCASFTPFVRRMLSAGEETAELPRMCSIVSSHYERETSHLTKSVSTLIEPVLIVLIAGLVLVVALAIFLPMWDMAKLMG